MPKRSYDQHCALTRALDVVGDRWTLPVIRELTLGPQRYTDLLHSLSGIGSNLLALRLRELRESGVIRQAILPPPSASVVYELTDLGEGLRPTIATLLEWGLHFLEQPHPGDRQRLSWHVMAMCARGRARRRYVAGDVYEFSARDEVVHVVPANGTAEVRQGHAHSPNAIVTCELDVISAIATGCVQAIDMVLQGQLTVSGAEPAVGRCLAMIAGDAPPRTQMRGMDRPVRSERVWFGPTA